MVQIQAPFTRITALPHSSDTPPMGHLEAKALMLLHNSLYDNEYQAYMSALELFKGFRAQYSFCESWPASVDHLLHYIAFLSLRRYAYRTMCLYINAISQFHKIRGHQDTTKVYVVSETVEDLLRSVGYNTDLRIPISSNMFR